MKGTKAGKPVVSIEDLESVGITADSLEVLENYGKEFNELHPLGLNPTRKTFFNAFLRIAAGKAAELPLLLDLNPANFQRVIQTRFAPKAQALADMKALVTIATAHITGPLGQQNPGPEYVADLVANRLIGHARVSMRNPEFRKNVIDCIRDVRANQMMLDLPVVTYNGLSSLAIERHKTPRDFLREILDESAQMSPAALDALASTRTTEQIFTPTTRLKFTATAIAPETKQIFARFASTRTAAVNVVQAKIDALARERGRRPPPTGERPGTPAQQDQPTEDSA